MNRLAVVVAITLVLYVLMEPVGLFGRQPNSGGHSHARVAEASSLSSVRTGGWNSPSTWSTGKVPAARDTVQISAGHVVTYDTWSNTAFGDITVAGTLEFARTGNTRLKVRGNVIVMDGGALDMGKEGNIIPGNARAELIFVLTTADGRAFVGGSAFQSRDKGLWVMSGGRWDAHGAPVKRTWVELSTFSMKGDTSVLVQGSVADWPVGSTVVITSTREPTGNSQQNELRTIASVESLGGGITRINLDLPLSFFHSGEAPKRGEVALLSRNVKVSTEIPGVSESSYVNDVRKREFAHTMFMQGAKGNLQYAEFKYMGNYGTPGRYAVHYHMMGSTSRGMVMRGNSGWYNGFRCLNIHSSQQVLVEDNVCYSSSSSSYFVEMDSAAGPNLDNVFVHNIAIGMLPKHFDDRNKTTVAGETRRVAADFWPGTSTNEAFLGNVAVGDGGPGDWDSQGYHFPELSTAGVDSGGIVPWTMVRNEAHSKVTVGINTWQNSVPSRDIVDTLLWRNHAGGVVWGAYSQSNKYFRAQLLQNRGVNFDVTSISSFLQDSVIAGTGASTDVGYKINSYIVPQFPGQPAWLVRNSFQDLGGAAITLDHRACPDPTREKRPAIASGCGPVYMANIGNNYQSVAKPLDFGWQANANAFVKYLDNVVGGLPVDNVVFLRKDMLELANQGPISQWLVSPASTYDAAPDALSTPASSLPPSTLIQGLLPPRPEVQPLFNYTFTSVPDYPPTVDLAVTSDGTQVTLQAAPADDHGVNRVEFYVDWVRVGVRNAAPYEVTVDLTSLPHDGTQLGKRKYAYVYAVAYDGAQQIEGYDQRAYSQVIELGP